MNVVKRIIRTSVLPGAKCRVWAEYSVGDIGLAMVTREDEDYFGVTIYFPGYYEDDVFISSGPVIGNMEMKISIDRDQHSLMFWRMDGRWVPMPIVNDKGERIDG
jgi:hypothetical protein